jgi:hypothetical protein
MKTIGAIIGGSGPRAPKDEAEAVKLAIFCELARQQADHGTEPLIFRESSCSIRVLVDIPALLDAIQGALTQ